MKRKILSLLLVFSFLVGASSGRVMAVPISASTEAVPMQDAEAIIYEYIAFDFMYLTKLDRAQSDALFNQLRLNGYVIPESAVIALPEGVRAHTSDKDIVLYMQDNYQKIVSNISDEEKKVIDSFLLGNALSYYKENVSIEEILERMAFMSLLLEEQEQASTRSSAAAVALLYIHSTSGSIADAGSWLNDTGHSWISIYNLSSSDEMRVGDLVIGPYEAATIGTFLQIPTNMSSGNYTGVWYNLEGRQVYYKDKGYNDRAHLSREITQAQLNAINSHITTNDKWTLTYHCTHFAMAAWNAVSPSGEQFSAGLIATPEGLKNSIRARSGHVNGGSVAYYVPVHYRAVSPVLSSIKHPWK